MTFFCFLNLNKTQSVPVVSSWHAHACALRVHNANAFVITGATMPFSGVRSGGYVRSASQKGLSHSKHLVQRFGPCLYVQFLVDVVDMPFHRFDADKKVSSDFLIEISF